MNGLFGDEPEQEKNWCERTNNAGKSKRNGAAGQHLVMADLGFRGIEAVIWDGLDADVLVYVGGYKGLQVKASTTNAFGPGGAWSGGGAEKKPLNEYKVDGFAFVYLPKRMVYYMTASAVQSRTVTINSFSLQACDMSFREMIRRWEYNGTPCNIPGQNYGVGT